MPVTDKPASPQRRKSAADTKARILLAAQKCFSESGYSNVGVREIAAVAGVNNTLIARYFGSKAELFEAALLRTVDFASWPQSATGSFADIMLNGIVAQDREGIVMALRSLGDADVREIIAKVINDRVIVPLSQALGPPNAKERALNIVIISCGYLLSTKVLPVGAGDNPLSREWMLQIIRQLADGAGARDIGAG